MQPLPLVTAPTNFASGNSVAAKHITILDFLRGVAALSVAVFHFVLPQGVLHKLYVPVMLQIFGRGNLGVEIFFVISGFVIPYSLLGKNYTLKRFFNYIAKRVIRINPPAYASMLLIILQWYLIEHFVTSETPYLSRLSFMQIVNNVLFTVPFTKHLWISGVFWTLAIEFQFYIILGLLFNYLFERNIIIFLLFFLIVGLTPYQPYPGSFFQYSSLFAMGGLTLFRRQNTIRNYLYLTLLALFCGICYYKLGLLPMVVGAATSLCIQYLSFSNVVTRFLGKISYSLYLIHLFAGLVCQFVLIKFIPTGPLINRVFMQLLCVIITVGSSYIFYLVAERPFIKLASRFKS